MTRREMILASFTVPLLGSDSGEFWNQKNSSQWTKDQRGQLLADSPWARKPELKFNGGPGPLGGPYGAWAAASGGWVSGNGGIAPTKSPGTFGAVVRWESATPVREAEAAGKKLQDDFAGFYVVSITGDVPMIVRGADETDDEYQSHLENLKEYTRLEKRGGPIYLQKIEPQPGKGTAAGTRFYFDRDQDITLHDGAVTFVTKLGPLDLKCKFPLKDMVYQGKLSL